MHVIFIPYGIKHAVDNLLKQMECQKFQLRMHKEGSPDQSLWIQGSVRVLPFGVIEYVFPRESLDLVLKALDCDTVRYPQYQGIKLRTALSLLRAFLMAKPIPKDFKKDQSLIWIKDNVSVIPIGIREDGDLVEPRGDYVGWTHEAI